MIQPAGHQLAELNVGRLSAPTDDPRVADFLAARGQVDGLGHRMPGFVWRLSDDEMDAAQTVPDGPLAHSRMTSTLSVCKDLARLEDFAWNTVHRPFCARKDEWHDAIGNGSLVLWRVPVGQRPTAAEGRVRWCLRAANGDSGQAIGWAGLKDAQVWKTHACGQVAAE